MKTKTKTYIISVFFIVICLAVVLSLIFPICKEIKKEADNFVLYKNNIFSLQSQAAQLQAFYQKKTEYQLSFEKANKSLADLKNPVDFIKFLEKSAKDSGANLDILPVPESVQKANNDLWQSTSFHLVSQGGFQGNLNLLNKIENAPYLVSIQNLKMIKGQQTNTVETDFSIKVFGK